MAKTCRLKYLILIASLIWPALAFADVKQQYPDYVIEKYGLPPSIPKGPLSSIAEKAVKEAFIGSVESLGAVSQSTWSEASSEALQVLVAEKDPRVVWLFTDLMRFSWRSNVFQELADAGAALLEIEFQSDGSNRWNLLIDHMIAWDIPAYPGYLKAKRSMYTSALYGWEQLFVEGDIDWRLVSWGGVPIDPRPFGDTDVPCNCIPAVDNPEVTSARDATWLKDTDIVFGIEINGQARAYPRQIMEVREMVNDTLGGRDLAIPYCTLCGAAQAYFTDRLPTGVKRPVMRTSGLLIRSNKVMYDITSDSIFDTFRGNAVTGPLLEIGLQLEQATVITSDWGRWKATYPNTTVLAERLALGKNYDFRNNRDANGPIFPVGDVDPRLPVQEDVIGVIAASGIPVAFPRGAALLALSAGKNVTFQNLKLQLHAGGIRVLDSEGNKLPSHEAFWFAWSQFYPETELWSG